MEKRYPHRYKEGKVMAPMTFTEFRNRVSQAELNLEQSAYLWLLYYSGARKSEIYERVVQDCQVTEQSFQIDLGKRKKGGDQTPPLEFPRNWEGVENLVKLYEKARARRAKSKTIYYQEETGKTRKTPQGKTVKIKVTRHKKMKGQWLFPHTSSVSSWRLVKKVLGEIFYPHYLRLNSLSEISADPSANIQLLKSFSGIKSISTLESYLGMSKKEQKAALSWREKQMQEAAAH